MIKPNVKISMFRIRDLLNFSFTLECDFLPDMMPPGFNWSDEYCRKYCRHVEKCEIWSPAFLAFE